MSSDVTATYALDLVTVSTGMATMDWRLNDMEERSELPEDRLSIIEDQLGHLNSNRPEVLET